MSPTRLAFALLALASSTACSAHGGDSVITTSPDAATSSNDASSSGVNCTQICAHVASQPGCSSGASTCMAQCGTLVSAGSASCSAQLSAFASCANSSPVVCSGTTANFTSCTAQQSALITCIGGSTGTPDASAPTDVSGADPCVASTDCASCTGGASCGWCNGHCYTGSGSGPDAPNSCGGSPWAWTSSECTSP